MSELPNGPSGADDPRESHAGVGGTEVEHAGGGRTEGETSVDEALGAGEDTGS